MSVTTHRRPGVRALALFALGHLIIKPLHAAYPLSGPTLRPLQIYNRCLGALMPEAEGTQRKSIVLGGRLADVIAPEGAPLSTDTAILYVHGGAFILGSPATHRTIGGYLATRMQLPVYLPSYRQLPNAGVGASVEDVVRAYCELALEHGIRRVLIAGDSAGGYLCGKIIERTHTENLPKPTALIAISPLLDLDIGQNPARSSRRDGMLPKAKTARMVPLWERGPVQLTGERTLANVPAAAFPPSVFITAAGELLEPDVLELAERLVAAHVDTEVHRYPQQLHAFPAMPWLVPEGTEAMAIAVTFARHVLKRRRKSADCTGDTLEAG